MRVLATLTLLAACADDLEAPDVDQTEALARTPPRFGGCGDLLLYAGNVADTWRIDVSAPGLVEDAVALGVPVELDLALPDPSVLVGAYRGTAVSSATCVGAYPYPGPQIDEAMDVIGGQLRLRVTPDPNATPNNPVGIAEVHLRNVTFAGSTQAFQVGRLDWEADVGPMPP